MHSVRKQFTTLEYDDVSENIAWNYLITCASLLAKGQGGVALDMAYRICQTCMSNSDLDENIKNACAGIFDILTNAPAINLSLARGFIKENYLKEMPIEFMLDIKRKRFINTVEDGESFVFLNDFQKQVYSSFEDTRLLSVSAPTSAGKSFVLLHLIKEYIQNNPTVKIAYIVPTRALIQQVEFDIRTIIKKNSLNAEVSSVPIKPDAWDTKACVLIFTQERLQWLIDESPDIVFDFIVADEAQKIGDGSRGIILQQVLQRVSVCEHTKFIFASPMSENPSSLLKIINYTDDLNAQTKQIISEIATVNQNLLWVYKEGTGTSKWNMDIISGTDRLRLGQVITKRITKQSGRLPILAYSISGTNTGNLIYCNYASEAEKIALQLMSLKLNDNPNLRISNRIKELIKHIKKTIHPNYSLVESLKAGVAFHYGNMPLSIRNEIEELFKAGEISFLVCTSTLIEGVNLPAKSIYIRGPQKGRNNPMNEMDFWNLAGRAGRQGKEFQGNIICLDATDNDVWKNGVPTERKKYRIKSTVDLIVETKSTALINYIAETNEITNTDKELEYGYTYFLSAYMQYGLVQNSPMKALYGEDFCKDIDNAFESALKNVEIPLPLLSKNQGINPLAQQKLLEYFRTSGKTFNELVPPYPEDDDAQEKYMHIIGRISKYITGESYKLNIYRSILITNWMRGYGLARIINENIKWHKEHNPSKKLAAIIRETMHDIEEFARFGFLKYTNCYLDILRYHYETLGEFDVIKQIPQISLWLEFGASQTTQISLMSMGFTRSAALELSDLIVLDDFDKEKCLAWLNTNDIYSLDLSAVTIKEVERILALQ